MGDRDTWDEKDHAVWRESLIKRVAQAADTLDLIKRALYLLVILNVVGLVLILLF